MDFTLFLFLELVDLFVFQAEVDFNSIMVSSRPGEPFPPLSGLNAFLIISSQCRSCLR
jgi:hypothetical protein